MLDFTEETTTLLSQHPDWVREHIEKGIALRRQAKTMADEANAIKTEGNALLSMAMKAAKAEKVESSIGSVTIKGGSRSNLNTGKLKEILVTKGVDPKVIKESIEEATTKSEYESITFTQKKA